MSISEVRGDLLEQDVDIIVNPWNRNFIPWWLLLPQGVSGAIKRKGGFRPFIEVRKHGLLSLGAGQKISILSSLDYGGACAPDLMMINGYDDLGRKHKSRV